MIATRMKECLAMLMIGDGVLAIVEPRRHLRVWEGGPSRWRQLVGPLANRPNLTRGLGVAGVALGVWLAYRQGEAPTGA